MTRRTAPLSALLLLVLAACGAAATPPEGDGPPATGSPAGSDGSALETVRVVATTTVLADLVAQVGRDRVVVDSLVPKGGEVHTFDPSPSDARRLADADVIVMNGLGLDEWLRTLVADVAPEVHVVELGEDLDGVEYLQGATHDEDEDASEAEHGDEVNPHLWLNVAYAGKYAERIRDALIDADEDGADAYTRQADAYAARLRELDRWAREQIGSIPEARRKVVSLHEAFPYLAQAYGLHVVGTVVASPGQEPSAGAVRRLVDAIRAERVSAIFSEVQFSDDVVRTIATETGAVVVADLYTDSLGDPPVDTYEGMIRWDVERVVQALR